MKLFKFAAYFLFFLILLLSGHFTVPAGATDQYARDTGKGCIFCHQQSTGGQLKPAGFAYIRNGYRYPIPQRILERAEALQAPAHRILRFVIGYLHLTAAVIFFGAIFYIHIFIRPTRLTGGIPKAERILGLSCMAVLTVTGLYLTWNRIDHWAQFVDNTFGLMLLIKICLFGLMVAIGLTAVTVIHRKMGQASTPADPAGDAISRSTIARFNGTDGRPARFICGEEVYDVTESPKWKDGRHFGKHAAGSDLTDALAGAPHGPEVFDRVKHLGKMAADTGPAAAVHPAHRYFVWMAYTNLVIIFLILGCIGIWRWGFPLRLLPETRSEAVAEQSCLTCHRKETPGICADWEGSVHARVDVGCYKCHRAAVADMQLAEHLTHHPQPISAVVTPTVCAGCHPNEAAQYAGSKHANTNEIIWQVDYWLQDGMNNDIERATGCYPCHGTVVRVENGKPVSGTWPNVGVGRVNPDGSLGSCSSCHTRHRFSVAEARKPEACDQCHLGPDHPQIEIFNESKHGTIYHAEGDRWNWTPENRPWQAGTDFRAPTCAVCHMSGAGEVPRTHDVTERLAWELQAPLTVRPSAFKPFPAKTDWRVERDRMQRVCRQCHAKSWVNDHFQNFDRAVEHYNENYYRPIRALIDSCYAEGLLSSETYFDEPLEWEFYELWHHEGRRARMGSAMMAPDYAWWHGFYELKRRFGDIELAVESLKKEQGGEVYRNLPGRSPKMQRP